MTPVQAPAAPLAAPLRGSYAKGLAKRAEIIRAAIALFGESGFHAASLRDIAARAGISHPGLLHHFPTKVNLLEAVLEFRDGEDRAAIADDMANGWSWIEAQVRLLAWHQEQRGVVELFAVLSAEATSVEHPAHDYFHSRYDAIVARAEESLRELASDGKLRDGVDPAVTARAFIAIIDGLQVQWLMATHAHDEFQVDMAADAAAFLGLVAKPGALTLS